VQRVFPDAHAAFAQFLPPEERGDLLTGYMKRLCDPDPQIHGPAARSWSMYEGSCSTLLPSYEAVSAFAQDRSALGLARIEAHYFQHNLFLPKEGLLGHMQALRNIPGEIIQGRYDMVCPAQSAFELAASWPLARLTLVPDAGHSALEPGVRTALLAALDRCRNLT
jgi:proline iminopeptidase